MEFEKITLFFNKRTGAIKEMCSGVQDMTRFGDEQQDYELIFDCLTIDYDSYVANNPNQFEIINGELKLKAGASLSKYL